MLLSRPLRRSASSMQPLSEAATAQSTGSTVAHGDIVRYNGCPVKAIRAVIRYFLWKTIVPAPKPQLNVAAPAGRSQVT